MADMSGLHILVVPSWWPSAEEPIRGIFFTDYVRAFAAAGARIGGVVPDLVGLRTIVKRPRKGPEQTRFPRRTPFRPTIYWEELESGHSIEPATRSFRHGQGRIGHPPAHSSPEGIPIVRIRGLHSAFGRIGRQVHAFRRWFERGLAAYRAQHGEPDVILACAALPAGWACTHLDDRLASRVVLLEMTGPFSLVMRPRTGESYVRVAMAAAAKVVVASERSRAEIRSLGIDRPIEVCGSPVADAFTTPVVSARSDSGRLHALFVGRMVREKGVVELAEAAAVLGREFNIEWHWVGDGPLADWVRRRFARAGLSDRLTMHGMLDRRRVVEAMAAASFFVLPTHGETFGQAVAEALCMGLPVVTTRGTACEEFVDAANGVLVDIGSVESLAEGLRQLVDRILSYDRVSIAESARRRFSGAAVASRYANFFCAACAMTRTGN